MSGKNSFTIHPGEILVPFQVLAELKLGAAKSARPEHHSLQVDAIHQPFAIAWPDIAAVEHYVDIRSSLEKSGTLISQPDLWIAAINRVRAGSSSPTTRKNSSAFPA